MTVRSSIPPPSCTPSANHGAATADRARSDKARPAGDGARPGPSTKQTHSAKTPQRVRLVTYNVHGCVGRDGVHDVSRVYEVLTQIAADVVVLQELDVGRARSDHAHHPEVLAKALGMTFAFCPTVMDGDEHYGHAVLSKRPAHRVRAANLPRATWPRAAEPRSALWVELDLDMCKLQIIGTHLGLSPWERRLQARALTGPEWMGDERFRGARLLCGDFNVPPGSLTYRKLVRGLHDAQRGMGRARERPTFPAWMPLVRLDHVLVSDEVRVTSAYVERTPAARSASDHLPVVVDLELTS